MMGLATGQASRRNQHLAFITVSARFARIPYMGFSTIDLLLLWFSGPFPALHLLRSSILVPVI